MSDKNKKVKLKSEIISNSDNLDTKQNDLIKSSVDYVPSTFLNTISEIDRIQNLISTPVSNVMMNTKMPTIPSLDFFKNAGIMNDNIKRITDGLSSYQESIEKLKLSNWYHTLSKKSYEDIDNNQLEIFELKKKIKLRNEEIEALKSREEDTSQAKEEIQRMYSDLETKYSLANILSRLNNDGSELLMTSNQFLSKFNHLSQTNAVVISIDIRRSTELMLKASSPEDFANFMTGLSDKLSTIIRLNFGVFDKFTGDGILAFFPDFYSGDQAILLALRAAQECHDIFTEHYNSFEDSFDVFLEDIGLGIGIDYGLVSIVNNKAELTVVGKPVVYACRFSGAKAGETLLGQNAKKLINERFFEKVELEATSIFIKNEGNARCFKVLKSNLIIENPDWSSFKNTINENLDDLTDDDVVAASIKIDN